MKIVAEMNLTRREMRTFDRARFSCAPHASNIAPAKTGDALPLVLFLLVAVLSIIPATILWGAL
jgi:hypothetical protein